MTQSFKRFKRSTLAKRRREREDARFDRILATYSRSGVRIEIPSWDSMIEWLNDA